MPAKKSNSTKTTSTQNAPMSTALVATTKTFPTRVDVPAKARHTLGALLNQRLADFLDLERQAKQAHWNVKGSRFMQLHLLFDKVAACAVEWADQLAERAVQLGVVAEGTVQSVNARTGLPKAPLNVANADEWVVVVSEALAYCANGAREDIEKADKAGDAVTTDILTKIAGDADKQLWFVESHLQP